MPHSVFTYDDVPKDVVKLLQSHLPFSLPLLRRVQYTKFPGGSTPAARVVLVCDAQEASNGLLALTKFTTAFVDVGGGRDTQMWFYSTLEDQTQLDSDEAVQYEEQLDALVKRIIGVTQEYGRELVYPGGVLLGSLHSSVRAIMEKSGRVIPRPTGIYDKWLFRVDEVPDIEDQLPQGMYWDAPTVDDCKIVLSRTDIPRTVEALSKMPGLAIKLADGTPISWAFLSPDGSLVSLHCEPEYRRRGFAKTLAAKLFRERTREFGEDGWCAADVSPDNDGSRGMCFRLKGKTYWQVTWVMLDVRDIKSSA
ncbi:hypothetical protein BGZ63DRAFT_391006 [Mariannaea sp. PMI_226]|nr:hypothetical protein BGZ63DRAFT_391006 [Mariannaea sp. PMI_226]